MCSFLGGITGGVSEEFPGVPQDVKSIVKWGVSHWITAAQAYLSKDPAFRDMIKRHPKVPLAPMKRVDLFRALTHAIINQQISGYAADAIHKRLVNLFPQKRMRARHLLTLPDTTLRQAGLSFNKARFLKDLARHVHEKRLPKPSELHKLTDEELIQRLTAILGIGPWTVQMLLIFKLGRPDVFPSADLGVQKGFQKLFRKRSRPTAKFLERYSLRWKPYRTLAAWYLWRASDDAEFIPVEGDLLWTKS